MTHRFADSRGIPRRFFLVSTVARSLDVHPRTIKRLIEAKGIGATPDGKRLGLEEIERFLRQRSIGADPGASCFLDGKGNPRRFSSVSQVADSLDNVRQTVSRRIRNKELEAYSVAGSTIRIPHDAVDALFLMAAAA